MNLSVLPAMSSVHARLKTLDHKLIAYMKS